MDLSMMDHLVVKHGSMLEMHINDWANAIGSWTRDSARFHETTPLDHIFICESIIEEARYKLDTILGTH